MDAIFAIGLLTEKYREAQRAGLCFCRCGESLRQGGETGSVVLCEEVWSGTEVCKTGTPMFADDRAYCGWGRT